jgi:hypothetical protein
VVDRCEVDIVNSQHHSLLMNNYYAYPLSGISPRLVLPWLSVLLPCDENDNVRAARRSFACHLLYDFNMAREVASFFQPPTTFRVFPASRSNSLHYNPALHFSISHNGDVWVSANKTAHSVAKLACFSSHDLQMPISIIPFGIVSYCAHCQLSICSGDVILFVVINNCLYRVNPNHVTYDTDRLPDDKIIDSIIHEGVHNMLCSSMSHSAICSVAAMAKPNAARSDDAFVFIADPYGVNICDTETKQLTQRLAYLVISHQVCDSRWWYGWQTRNERTLYAVSSTRAPMTSCVTPTFPLVRSAIGLDTKLFEEDCELFSVIVPKNLIMIKHGIDQPTVEYCLLDLINYDPTTLSLPKTSFAQLPSSKVFPSCFDAHQWDWKSLPVDMRYMTNPCSVVSFYKLQNALYDPASKSLVLVAARGHQLFAQKSKPGILIPYILYVPLCHL